jgi:SAM-dependent methyltransferase
LFCAGHHPEAANVPLEELAARVHELPRRGREIRVLDDDPGRAARAVALLRERGFDAAEAAPEAAGPRVGGRARVRLWEPNAFLAEVLPEVAAERPGGRALDLAAGSGRDAVFLALAGFRVTAVDLLPDALERARDLARREGTAIATAVRDLERGPADVALEGLPGADPEAPGFDLVLVVSYLHRPLLPAIRRAVRPGGFVVYETFLAEQAAMFGKPRNPAHLLAPGELRGHFSDWYVRKYREGLTAPRRLAASLFARKPG